MYSSSNPLYRPKAIHCNLACSCGRLTVTDVSIAFIPVAVGGLIYVLLRPVPPQFLTWFEYTRLNVIIDLLRTNTLQLTQYLPEWFVYSLPNGLWSFSYAFLIILLWNKQTSLLRYLWFATIPLVVFGYETLQFMEVISGTFCMVDLMFCALGLLMALVVCYAETKEEAHK